MTVASQQADQMERDFASMQLQARMEGLIDEMEQRRYIHIPDSCDCDEALDEDLDEYSQGQYSQIQTLLQEKLDQRVTIHDFRMVQGPTHTNLIFDVALPPEMKGTSATFSQTLTLEPSTLTVSA